MTNHGREGGHYQVVTAYLKANPQVARELASEHDLPVSSRGAVGRSTCAEIALLVR